MAKNKQTIAGMEDWKAEIARLKKELEQKNRELEIEAALERVRQSSIAMVKSEDLVEVVQLLDQEIAGLGIKVGNSSIITGWDIKNPQKGVDNWFARKGQKYLEKFHVPHFDHPIADRLKDAARRNLDYYTENCSQAEKDQYFKLLFQYSDFKTFPEEIQQSVFEYPAWIRAVVLSKNSILIFQRFYNKAFTREEEGIFRRFGKVFEQAYTRFLDLKKAEAQAREAQIEVALEKVRAHTMAMQRSDDLSETATEMFKQIENLGIHPWSCGFNIFNPEENTISQWVSSGDGRLVPPFEAPSDQDVFIRFTNAAKRGDTLYIEELEGEALKTHYDFLLKIPAVGKIAKELVDAGIQFPTFQVFNLAFFKYGYLMYITYEQVPEFHSIFTRFAKVFEQTYTRFLDLQKAEAQAREAQIEAALERVRSRSMAMQSSDETNEVISVLFKQFDVLGLHPAFAHLSLFNDDGKTVVLRMTDKSGERVMAVSEADIDAYPEWRESYEQWKVTEENFVHTIDYPAEVVPYILGLLKALLDKMPEEHRFTAEDFPNGFVTVQGHCRFGYMGVDIERKPTEEEKSIVARFAREFGRIYQRVLDLEKAEEQARESHIEVALERVRAASMSMHKTEDIDQVLSVFYAQLDALDLDPTFTYVTIYPTSETWTIRMTDTAGRSVSGEAEVRMDAIPVWRESYEHWKASEEFAVFTIPYTQKELPFVLDLLEDVISKMDPAFRPKAEDYPNGLWSLQGHTPYGWFGVNIERQPTEEDLKIVPRFSREFGRMYQRYLDLKKAEAQTREAQIEAALERVRARTMAMHSSMELSSVVKAIHAQLRQLELIGDFSSVLYSEYDQESYTFSMWATQIGGQEIVKKFNYRLDAHPNWLSKAQRFYSLKPEERKNHVVLEEYLGESFDLLVDLALQHDGLITDEFLDSLKKGIIPRAWYQCAGFFSHGELVVVDNKAFHADQSKIIQRFAAVFEQTYTRFLDLKKAEAQAREAEIEAALERVRAKTMAMHSSRELSNVVKVIDEQLRSLDIIGDVSSVVYDEYDEESFTFNIWITQIGGNKSLSHFNFPIDAHPNWLSKAQIFFQLKPEDRKNHFVLEEYIGESFDLLLNLALEKDGFITEEYQKGVKDGIIPRVWYQCSALTSHGELVIGSTKPFTEDQAKIIKRFAGVFEQSYTRFRDLQKAEKQAREAQIEAALERVRAASMALHHSDDIGNVLTVFYRQLKALEFNIVNTYVVNYNTATDTFKLRITDKAGNSISAEQESTMDPFPVWRESYEQWKISEEYGVFVFHYKQEELPSVFSTLDVVIFKIDPENIFIPEDFPDGWWTIQGHTPYGWFGMCLDRPPTEEELNITPRFSREFGRMYQRFLDLQKAETRAREAQIDAALERIRSRSMAMQSSEELQDILSLLFQQYDVLGIHPVNVFLTLFDFENDQFIYRASGKGGVRAIGQQTVKFSSSDIWREVIEKFRNEKSGATELIHYPKESLEGIFEIFHEAFTAVPEESQIKPEDFPDGIYTTHGHFEHGYLGINHIRPATEEEEKIIARFSTEFGRVYRRFLDLKLAEDQARESLKQAALDRVRGEIASMRTTEDLSRITPVIWRELMTLEVPFIRCGVFMVDEEAEEVQAWLSTPDGKALGVLHLHFGINEQTNNIVKYWKKKAVYTEHWDANRFILWTQSMVELGQIQDVETYQGAAKVPEELHLHFVPFRQGMLYVGNVDALQNEKIQLVRTLADAFSAAYARYEDFNRLELAKKQVDMTLNDLQQTQQQLIQSEKMASLGELTAGIAHEIQNPLNFVNNFSEVSEELLDELVAGLDAGDVEEVKAIVGDLKQNLLKINHHGKRADAIVKSMLQHSRTSSGEKELTDINTLCDEYLRLAYLGFRAKDKSFNADFKTEFDPNLPKIQVIPQDIGRVLLNIINNGFQAVQDVKNPVLAVSTKRSGDQIEIRIADNGPGIPDHIKDKIFQPFFTTKPTGQGTGLGLSLSYDLVKAHGGNLKVETKEGEGSELIIQLPV